MQKYNPRDMRILYELSYDSRVKQKDICRKLHISPQLLNYTIDGLKKKKIILGRLAVMDPARFGLTGITPFYSYIEFKRSRIEEMISYLCRLGSVVRIIELWHGADLMVEFSVTNLSSFNKINSEFLERFSDSIGVVGVYPVAVRHIYSKRYLYKKSKRSMHLVLSGDREPVNLNRRSKLILRCLADDPSASVIKIASKTGIDPRTVAKTVSVLKERRVIRGFSILIDNQALGISSCIMLLNLTDAGQDEVSKLIEYCRGIAEITDITKVIGRYSLMITIESLEKFSPIVDMLRDEFRIVDHMIFDVRRVRKHISIPADIFY